MSSEKADEWLLGPQEQLHSAHTVSGSVGYLRSTVTNSQRKVSLQWFQYCCGETFHSLWVASLVHTRSLGSNKQTTMTGTNLLMNFLSSSAVTVPYHNEDAIYNYRLTRKQHWITCHNKKLIQKNYKGK